MKKTLLVTSDFYPSLGGIAQYWEKLSDTLPVQDWVVLAPLLPVGVSEKEVPYRIYRKKFYSKWFWPHWVKLIWLIASIVRTEHIRCIIVGQILPIGSAVRIASFFLGIPYIISVHGMDLGMARRKYRKYMLAKGLIRNAHTFLANSSYTVDLLRQFGADQERITLVYPCADIPRVEHIKRTGDAYPILLTVTRLVKRKGIQDVIEALPGVLKVFPTCKYVIVGGGRMRSELEQSVRQRGLDSHVIFAGSVTGVQKEQYYRECDIFIMTPYEENGDVEGFGTTYLEANSFGKAVIGTKSGGISDAVTDGVTGILVEERSIDKIREAILHLAQDPNYASRLGTQGMSRVKSEFQWAMQAKKIEKILTYL